MAGSITRRAGLGAAPQDSTKTGTPSGTVAKSSRIVSSVARRQPWDSA